MTLLLHLPETQKIGLVRRQFKQNYGTMKKYIYYSVYEYYDGKIKSKRSWKVKDGMVKKENELKSEYYYDSKGNIIKKVVKDLNNNESFRACDQTTEYTYLSFDDKGNWVERKWIDPMTELDYAEKREIKYY